MRPLAIIAPQIPLPSHGDMSQIVLPDYESARTEARWSKKDPTKKHAAETRRLLRNFHFSIFVAASADDPGPGLCSAWHLCFEGYTKYPNTLTTWRTAHDLKRGIAGASGSGLTNPGKKGDHLSQDLKKDSYWCLRSSRVRGPKCDDMLMMLSPAARRTQRTARRTTLSS